MSVMFNYVHRFVFPDGTVQDLEQSPGVGEGELVPSAQVMISNEPIGKFVVTFIEDRPQALGPIQRYYHLDKF